ncbi:MAG: hypothetical protein V7606_153 [Burkholderiales bacterium]|jgi:hypothetical protein
MELFKSNLAVGITAAIAATVLAPVLVPIITVAGRPLAKSLLKGGVILYEKGRETVAGAGEVVEDLIAEVRSEMEQQPRTVAASAEVAAGGAAQRAGVVEHGGGDTVSEVPVSPRDAGTPTRPAGNGAHT